MEKVRLLIADDNSEFVNFLKKSLEENSEIEVLGCAYTVEQEIYMIDNLKPDIVVTDLIKEGNLTGLELIRKYKSINPNTKFLVITGLDNEVIDVSIIDEVIKKPFANYDIVIKKILKIKNEIEFERMSVNSDNRNIIKKRNNWKYFIDKIRNNINKKGG